MRIPILGWFCLLSITCVAQDSQPVSRIRSTALAAKPRVRANSLIDLIGYSSPTDGYHCVVQYLPTSQATVDKVFVFAPAQGDPGRLVAIDRSVLDLEYAGCSEGEDITALLTRASENFTGGGITIKLPRSIARLVCDKVTFPAGLNRFEVLAGSCTVAQKSDTKHLTIWEIPHPTNVFIEMGVRFSGIVSQTNWKNAGVQASNHGLLTIATRGKTVDGGTIVCHADFSNATANGLLIAQSLAKKYDRIEIAGNYTSAGIGCNTLVDHVTITASTSDPDDWNSDHSKCRGVSVGRVARQCHIDLQQRYNGGLFMFAMNGAQTSIRIVGTQMGYRSDGRLADTRIGTLAKVDTLRQGGTWRADLTYIDCAPNFCIIAAESSPGPSVNCRFLVNHPDGSLRLAELEDDGPDNYECYGNEVLPGSVLDNLKMGPASFASRCQLNKLYLPRHTNIPTNDVFVPSAGCRIFDTNVENLVALGRGVQAKFRRCHLPTNFTFDDVGSEPYVLDFDNCRFGQGTVFAPTNLADLRLGFSGTNPGIDLANVPVQSLPYLRLDAIGHPRHLNVVQDINSTLFESINRPAGWQSSGPARPVWYSGSAIRRPPAAFCKLIDINTTTCVGGMVFPQISNASQHHLGSFQWDTGVSNGVIEAAITFKATGAPQAGILGRADHDMSTCFAWLDRTNNTVNLRIGRPHTGPSKSAAVMIKADQEHILALECSGETIRVFVDGTLKLSAQSSFNSAATKWGIKHLNGVGLNAIGPTWRYLEIRPVAGDASVETERRSL